MAGIYRPGEAPEGAGARSEPSPPPLAPRGEEAVSHQELEDVGPGGALPAGWQALPPELVEFELCPELAGNPAGPLLPWALQAEIPQADPLADVRGVRGYRAVGGEQREAELAVRALLEDLDAAEPAGLLAIVDLPKVQEVPTDTPAVGAPVLLGDSPVPVLPTLIDAGMALQVHRGRSVAQSPARARAA
jgi:hypothetical protein